MPYNVYSYVVHALNNCMHICMNVVYIITIVTICFYKQMVNVHTYIATSYLWTSTLNKPTEVLNIQTYKYNNHIANIKHIQTL